MKYTYLNCAVLVALIGCAGGLSKEELVAQETAKRDVYNKNYAQATAMLQDCQKLMDSMDDGMMMKYEMQILDAACQMNLAQMEVISQVWDFAISRSVYMEDTDASTELAKHKLKVSERGMDLVGAAANECITKGMQQIRSSSSQKIEGFNELLEFYTVYTQIYELVDEPYGSLVSYRQAINDLRLETTKLSSRLSIVLQ